jgi:hypothetical protein
MISRVRDRLANGVDPARELVDEVLGTSLMTASPPAMSPDRAVADSKLALLPVVRRRCPNLLESAIRIIPRGAIACFPRSVLRQFGEFFELLFESEESVADRVQAADTKVAGSASASSMLQRGIGAGMETPTTLSAPNESTAIAATPRNRSRRSTEDGD